MVVVIDEKRKNEGHDDRSLPLFCAKSKICHWVTQGNIYMLSQMIHARPKI